MPDASGTVTFKVRDLYLFFAFFIVMVVLTLEMAMYRFSRDHHYIFWRMMFYRCIACGKFGHLGTETLCHVIKATCHACGILHDPKDCPDKNKKTKAEGGVNRLFKKGSWVTKKVNNRVSKDTLLGDFNDEKYWFTEAQMEGSSDTTTTGSSSSDDTYNNLESKYTLDVKPVKQRKVL